MVAGRADDWGMEATPPLSGDPFTLARSSCRHAAQVARDVFIEEAALQRFAAGMEPAAVRDLPHGSMGENCDTAPADFTGAKEAANFALLFCLLQFGHGFRTTLHRRCGRGASQTITRGVRALHASGGLKAARLRQITATEVPQAFVLPATPDLAVLVQQLETVLHQAGSVLEGLGLEDFAAFCQRVWEAPASAETPAATLVGQLVRTFPAFNDQGR